MWCEKLKLGAAITCTYRALSVYTHTHTQAHTQTKKDAYSREYYLLYRCMLEYSIRREKKKTEVRKDATSRQAIKGVDSHR